MEILIDRLTSDANIVNISDEKQVVNFAIAINDGYFSTGENKFKKLTKYVDAHFGRQPAYSPFLKNGMKC